jgi:hypothetical protein
LSGADVATLLGLLEHCPPAAEPRRWLCGRGDYAGVIARHPCNAGLWVVASDGHIGYYPAEAPADPAAALGFASDCQRRVERLLLDIIAQDPETALVLDEELASTHQATYGFRRMMRARP